MKPGSPPPPPPDDEAADPLLTALRERLGDYGQAPPPGAWATIRRQVAPAPLPRPWWRRRPPLVLLGLLICCLVPGRLGEYVAWQRAGLPADGGQPQLAKHSTSSPTSMADARNGRVGRRAASSAAVDEPATATTPDLAASSPATSLVKTPVGATSSLAQTSSNKNTKKPQALKDARFIIAAASHSTETLASTRRTGRPTGHAQVATQAAARSQNNTTKAAANAAIHNSRAARDSAVDIASASPEAARGPRSVRHRKPHFGTETTLEATDSLAAAAPTEAAAPLAAFLASGIFPFGPVDSLAWKQSGLLLPAVAPLATLVARPDSAPAAPLVRRWALLVLAGPTVSYRTLGPAPTLAAGHPDFARLERPALGLGAQVQVRRVLSGRWALAVGLGYHEYATRLALNLRDTLSLHQRDTYRLLTVPVQFSYALGVPKSRLSKALLLGAEPGWYLGGRSTEGSGCGCEQQSYSSAAGSPYRSLTVAFSLGLDLRYRLGGAGARWQWLVQPTGRYVATPFVRRDAVGFTQRQPFSLGLLTGFSWDVR